MCNSILSYDIWELYKRKICFDSLTIKFMNTSLVNIKTGELMYNPDLNFLMKKVTGAISMFQKRYIFFQFCIYKNIDVWAEMLIKIRFFEIWQKLSATQKSFCYIFQEFLRNSRCVKIESNPRIDSQTNVYQTKLFQKFAHCRFNWWRKVSQFKFCYFCWK